MKKGKVISFLLSMALVATSVAGLAPAVANAQDTNTNDGTATPVFTKLSEDTTLTLNSDTGMYEGKAQLQVTGLADDQEVTVSVKDIKDANGCTMNVTFTDDSNAEAMTFTNGDIINISYCAGNWEYQKDYSVTIMVNGSIVTVYQVPEIDPGEWQYSLKTSTIVLEKYIGSGTEVTVYPKYSVNGKEYDTVMKVTEYDTAQYEADADESNGDSGADGSEVTKASGPFINNTAITKVTFLDGVKIGTDDSKDTVICGDNTTAVGSGYSAFSYDKLYDALDEPGSVDFNGNATVMELTGQNMKGMFAGCTSLKTVEGIPDGVVKMENTFRDCTSLESISNLPSGLIDMGKAFQNCESLVDVPQIPATVVNMGAAFKNCKSLNPTDRLVVPKTVKCLIEAFKSCNSMELCPIIYPETGIYNMKEAFYNCYAMTELPVVPDNVVAGFRMFMGCRNATQVYDNQPIRLQCLSSGTSGYYFGVDTLDAFRGCKKLKADIYYPDNIPMSDDGYIEFSVHMDAKNHASTFTIRTDGTISQRYYTSSISSNPSDTIKYDATSSENAKAISRYIANLPSCFMIKGNTSPYFSTEEFTQLCQSFEDELANAYGTSAYKITYSAYGFALEYTTEYQKYETDAFKTAKVAFWESAIEDGSGITVYFKDDETFDNARKLVMLQGSQGTNGATGTSRITAASYSSMPSVTVDYTANDTPASGAQGKATDITATLNPSFSPRYGTTLTLNYYTYADFTNGVYSTTPGVVKVTSYGESIDTLADIPADRTTVATMPSGFANTQVWSFDGWSSDNPSQPLSGVFTGTANQVVNLYETYALSSESYIVSETLDGLVVARQPDATDYVAGDTFDDKGMQIDAKYRQVWNDGHETERIDTDTAYDVDKDTPLAVDDTHVTVSKTDNGVTKTVDVPVTVSAFRTVTVSGVLKYSDGTPIADRLIELHSDVQTTRTDTEGRYTFDGVETGSHTLTVYMADDTTVDGVVSLFVDDTYKADGSRDSATITTTNEIAFNTSIDGNSFHVDGSIHKATEPTVTKPVVTEPADDADDDSDDGSDDEVTEAVTEHHEVITGIKVITPPDKTDYIDGEDFLPDGMVVAAICIDNEGFVRYVPVNDYTTDKGMLTVGDDKVIVSWNRFTDQTPVNVEETPQATIVNDGVDTGDSTPAGILLMLMTLSGMVLIVTKAQAKRPASR